jgi:hypothetical protein
VISRPRTGLLGRVAFFLTLSVGWNGYEFGRADHGIHLVFVDRLLHPGRWQGDFLDRAADNHPSLVWWLEAGLSWLLGMPIAFGLLHLLALIATAWSIECLVRSLGGKTSAVWIALLALAPAQFSLAGVSTLDPLFIPRGAALPLEIFALALLVQGRMRMCFLTLGAAACLHAPSAAGLAVASSFVVLVRTLRRAHNPESPEVVSSKERDFLAPLWFFTTAAPVLLLWLMGSNSGAGVSPVGPQWMTLLDARLGHHINPGSWPPRDWLKAALWLAVGGLAGASSVTLKSFRLEAFVVITGLLTWAFGAGSLLARTLQLDLALQLEPWECFRLITICCSVFIAVRLGDALRNAGPKKTMCTFGVFLVLSLLVSNSTVQRSSTWLPNGKQSDERDLVEATSSLLGPESKVLWPPQGFEYDRWRAGSPGTPTWKDGGEVLFDEQLAQEWLDTTAEVCSCNPLDFSEREPTDRLSALRAHLQTSWESRSQQGLSESARRLGATHFVLLQSQRTRTHRARSAGTAAKPLVTVGEWVLVPTGGPQ